MSEPLPPLAIVKGRESAELAAMVAKWQGILRLGQWRIRSRYLRVFDIGENRQGEIVYTDKRNEALLSVLEPTDYDPACIYPQDVERTVVHELLHLVLHPICPPGDKDDVLEPIIHVLDQAFISVARGKKK